MSAKARKPRKTAIKSRPETEPYDTEVVLRRLDQHGGELMLRALNQTGGESHSRFAFVWGDKPGLISIRCQGNAAIFCNHLHFSKGDP